MRKTIAHIVVRGLFGIAHTKPTACPTMAIKPTVRLRAVALLAVAAAMLLAGAQPAAAAKTIEVIVNNQLYTGGQVTSAVATYLNDLRTQGYTPTLVTQQFTSAYALRNHLSQAYSQQAIQGAVLIGNMPGEYFERSNEFNNTLPYERFVSDLYLQDLNGTWSDADSNGTYDTHTGLVAPEIWISRISTANLTGLGAGRTEAGMINSYLAKDHRYRTGQLTVTRDSLAYIDDDWQSSSGAWIPAMATGVSGTLTSITDKATTTAADYKLRLGQEHEQLLLAAHSSATLHRFKINSDWGGGDVNNTDIAPAGPKTLFYNLFACQAGDYTTDGYLAGEYVFGNDYGLLAVATTKEGGMYTGHADYYGALGKGETFGEAWMDWWNARAYGGFASIEKDWLYGMTMYGDPTLMTQAYMPEPCTVAFLSLGLTALIARRRGRKSCFAS